VRDRQPGAEGSVGQRDMAALCSTEGGLNHLYEAVFTVNLF